MTDDPIPEAVRAIRHIHTLPAQYLGHDQGAAILASETRERAFWAGIREVIREEVTALLEGRQP
jgi:hypothetical protein